MEQQMGLEPTIFSVAGKRFSQIKLQLQIANTESPALGEVISHPVPLGLQSDR